MPPCCRFPHLNARVLKASLSQCPSARLPLLNARVLKASLSKCPSVACRLPCLNARVLKASFSQCPSAQGFLVSMSECSRLPCLNAQVLKASLSQCPSATGLPHLNLRLQIYYLHMHTHGFSHLSILQHRGAQTICKLSHRACLHSL